MERYLKVETDKTHVRDMESNAIVNRNKSEFDLIPSEFPRQTAYP